MNHNQEFNVKSRSTFIELTSILFLLIVPLTLFLLVKIDLLNRALADGVALSFFLLFCLNRLGFIVISFMVAFITSFHILLSGAYLHILNFSILPIAALTFSSPLISKNTLYIPIKNKNIINNKIITTTPNSSDITEIEDWIWYLDATRSNDIDINQNTSAIFESLSDSITSYKIELIVETNYGCLDTAFGEIAVLSTPEADFAIPTEDVPNYGTYLLDATSSTTGIGNSASPEFYDYNWIISDGPYDLVSILNSKDDNDKFYFPSPDSLYYQFNYFLYGENDFTEICLIVGNTYDISSGTEKTCQDTVCKNVRIQAWGELFVPNALYPEASDDGSRLFLPKGKSLVEYNLQIFDKFGNLVWENNELNVSDGSPKIGWDGTSNGSLLPQGTYIWKIAAKFINGPWNGIGDNNKKTGTVYLIR